MTAFRLEVLPDDSLPGKGPGRAGNGNFVLSEFLVSVLPTKTALESDTDESTTEGESTTAESKDAVAETVVPLQNATATHEQTAAAGENPYGKWAVEAAIDGDAKGKTWGWAILEESGQANSAVFETAADLTLSEGSTLKIVMAQNLDNPGHNVGCFRLSVATSPRPIKATETPPENLNAILAVAADERSDVQQTELAAYYRTIAPLLNPVRDELAALQKKRDELDATIPSTLITEAVAPRMVRILPRGNWMDDSGEEVTPAISGSAVLRCGVRPATESTGPRKMDRVTRKSAHAARRGESTLEDLFWSRDLPETRRPGGSGRMAQPSVIARLSGR